MVLIYIISLILVIDIVITGTVTGIKEIMKLNKAQKLIKNQ